MAATGVFRLLTAADSSAARRDEPIALLFIQTSGEDRQEGGAMEDDSTVEPDKPTPGYTVRKAESRKVDSKHERNGFGLSKHAAEF